MLTSSHLDFSSVEQCFFYNAVSPQKCFWKPIFIAITLQRLWAVRYNTCLFGLTWPFSMYGFIFFLHDLANTEHDIGCSSVCPNTLFRPLSFLCHLQTYLRSLCQRLASPPIAPFIRMYTDLSDCLLIYVCLFTLQMKWWPMVLVTKDAINVWRVISLNYIMSFWFSPGMGHALESRSIWYCVLQKV